VKSSEIDIDLKPMRIYILIAAVFTFSNSYSADVSEQVKQQKRVLLFIENKGQIMDQNLLPNLAVKYLFNGPGMNIQLRAGGFSYDVYTCTEQNKSTKTTGKFDLPDSKFIEPLNREIHFQRVDMNLLGADNDCNIVASEQASDYLNYFTTGTSEAGATFVHHYSKVTYQNVFPNIDIEFVADEARGAKYNFILKPGADIHAIRLKIDVASNIILNEGKLLIVTNQGNVEETIPSSYLIGKAGDSPIVSKLINLGDNVFGLSVEGDIPVNTSLVIDPVLLRLWSTYYGGTGGEIGHSCPLDRSGNVFLVGQTNSTTALPLRVHIK
jgi:hypothetical protein